MRIQNAPFQVVLLILAAGVLFFLRLDAKRLMDNEESRFALQARVMIETGDWVVPRWSQRPQGTKPPLFTWAVAALSKASGGVSEWTARLPSAAAALATVLVVYFLGVRLFGRTAGFLGALVLASSFLFWDQARFAKSDMFLTCFLTISVVCLIRGAEAGARSSLWLLGAFAAAGLAVLSKGPVGVVLPAWVGFLYLTLRRRWGRFPLWSFGAGVLVFVAIVSPWYILYAQTAGGEHIREMLFRQNVTRYLSAFDHRKSLFFYLAYFPSNFLPWMGLTLAALVYGASRSWRNREAGVMVFLWWAAIFLFFSLSTSKRPAYILPAFPPAALLTGFFIRAEVLGTRGAGLTRRDWGWWGGLILGITFAGLAAGGIGFVLWAGIADPEFLPSALLLGGIWIASGAAALWTQRRGRPLRAIAVFVCGILATQGASQWSLAPRIDSRLGTAATARKVVRAAAGAHIVSFRFPKASLAFYGAGSGGKNGEGEGKAGEFYYFRQPWRLRYFLNDFQAPAFILLQTKEYRKLPEDIRSKMTVVERDLRFGRHRTVLLKNRPYRPGVSRD